MFSGSELWVLIKWIYLGYLCLFLDASSQMKLQDFPHSYWTVFFIYLFFIKPKLPEVFLRVRSAGRFRLPARHGAVCSAGGNAMNQRYRPADVFNSRLLQSRASFLTFIRNLRSFLSNCKRDPAVDLHRLRPLFLNPSVVPAAFSPAGASGFPPGEDKGRVFVSFVFQSGFVKSWGGADLQFHSGAVIHPWNHQQTGSCSGKVFQDHPWSSALIFTHKKSQ